jgi:C1A family cysteine protease
LSSFFAHFIPAFAIMKSALLLATVAAATPTDDAWEQFKIDFPKTYNGETEEATRKGIFAANYATIQEWNSRDEKYKLGVNQFADLTETEWKATYTGAIPPPAKDGLPYLGRLAEVEVTADALDWTTMGAVTPVKDQGQCGSCWSFSTTGAMEGANQVASGRLVSLAEQQYVDCDTADGNAGCNGGWPYLAMTYASKNGACTESTYPYTAVDGTCKQSSCSLGLAVGAVTGYSDVSLTDTALASALMGTPVSVTVNAAGSFQMYTSGVLTGGCHGSIDHAVLATGFGTLSGTTYWRVKNSWGTRWGDGGYVNIERDASIRNGAYCILQYPPVVTQISAAIEV